MLSCQDLGLCEEDDKSLGGLLMLLGLGVVGCGIRGPPEWGIGVLHCFGAYHFG